MLTTRRRRYFVKMSFRGCGEKVAMGNFRSDLLVRRGILKTRTDVVRDQAERQGQQERDAPTERDNVSGREQRLGKESSRGAREQTRSGRSRNERAVQATMADRSVLCQEDGSTGILASCGEALDRTQDQQQQRRSQADNVVARKQTDEECSARHNEDGDGQRPFTTLLVAHAAPEHGAERTEDEGNGENSEREKRRVDTRVRREEDFADLDGEVGVGCVIEPLDEVTKEGRQGYLANDRVFSSLCRSITF